MNNDSNARKSRQLGMPFGTANGRLRKMLLFDLVKRFNLDDCFRCGLKIETIEEFSIEHKRSWLDVDPALFWDLDNITYSHLNCNCAAGNSLRPKATICWMCRVNPAVRRESTGRVYECPPCHTIRQQQYRARLAVSSS